MLPLRLVIDTNVLVSAALKSEGLQRTTLLLATTKPARLYGSHLILDEYADVLSRPELRIRRGLRLQLLQLIKNNVHIVVPSRRLDVCDDPDDNIFVECAEKAGADYLITGNSRHFSEVLEEDQDHHRPRIYQSFGSASHILKNHPSYLIGTKGSVKSARSCRYGESLPMLIQWRLKGIPESANFSDAVARQILSEGMPSMWMSAGPKRGDLLKAAVESGFDVLKRACLWLPHKY